MALLQNIVFLSQYPLKQKAAILTQEKCFWNQNHGTLNKVTGLSTQKLGVPAGNCPPYSWEMPLKEGGMSSYRQILCSGTLSPTLRYNGNITSTYPRIRGIGSISVASLSGSIKLTIDATGSGDLTTTQLNIIAWSIGDLSGEGNISFAELVGPLLFAADLSGEGDVTQASLVTMAQLLADVTGAGEITTADMLSILTLLASVSGQGDLTDAALKVIAWCVADLLGEGDVVGNARGDMFMSADIAATGEVMTPQSIAAAVWSALAAAYNDPGTMGQALGAAGSAGDPWITELPGGYTGDQAGNIIGKRLLTLAKFLALK